MRMPAIPRRNHLLARESGLDSISREKSPAFIGSDSALDDRTDANVHDDRRRVRKKYLGKRLCVFCVSAISRFQVGPLSAKTLTTSRRCEEEPWAQPQRQVVR